MPSRRNLPDRRARERRRRVRLRLLVAGGVVAAVAAVVTLREPVDRGLAALAEAAGDDRTVFVAGALLGALALGAVLLVGRYLSPRGQALLGAASVVLVVLAMPSRTGDAHGAAGPYVRWGVVTGLLGPFLVLALARRALYGPAPRGHAPVLLDRQPGPGDGWAPHWLPCCDCGWQGEDSDDQATARAQLDAHAPGHRVRVERAIG